MREGSKFGSRFEIAKEQNASMVSVRLYGEFDLAWEPYFRELSESLRNNGLRHVVLDLRGLTFIDSSGLRSILALWDCAKEDGFDLTIVRGAPPVHKVFAMTGLDGVLPIVADGSVPRSQEVEATAEKSA